jgi:hypothetical protein
MNDMDTIHGILIKINDDFVSMMNDNLSPKLKSFDYVYHYTSIDSFVSIMRSNELWFSHALYLNDPLEIAFGLDVIINILNKKKNDYTTVLNIIEKQRNVYKEYSLDLSRDLVFLFSFSELSDKLSSWIQYGDSGHGVCLEFIRPILLKNIGTHTTGLRGDIFFPIQYFSSEFIPHSNNIKGFNKALFDYYKRMENFIKKKEMEKEPNVQRTLYETTKSIACFIKNDFHASEKEWRYAVFSGIGDRNIILKQSNHGIKMFYKVPFENEKLIHLIDSIIIGPKHNRDPRIAAALEILIYQEQATMHNTRFSKGILRE